MKRLLGLLFMVGFLLVLVPGVLAMPPSTCGNVSDVQLVSPLDFNRTGDNVNLVEFVGLWIENPGSSQSTTECQLQIFAADGSLNYTGDLYSVSEDANYTFFANDSDSFLNNHVEGLYYWNIACYTNISNSCELQTATVNQSITFDFSGPNITLFTPSDNAAFAVDEEFNVTFNVNDQYDSGEFSCLAYDPIQEFVTSVFNEENGTISISQENAGVYPWYVSCIDNFGNIQNSTTLTYIIDDDDPVVSLLSPSNGSIITDNSTVEINYSVTDQYDPLALSCTVYIDGASVNVSSVANDTIQSFNYTFGSDGIYDIGVTCVDQVGNSGASGNITVTLDVGALTPVIYELPTVVTDLTLELIGYTSRPGDVNVTISNDNFPFTRSNQTATNSPASTASLGSTTVSEVYDANEFRIETDIAGNITVGTFLNFAGHNLLNFVYYAVTDVIPVTDYFRINITPDFNQSVSIGEAVSFFDADRPTGWFNISIDLIPGTNNLSVFGSQFGISGDVFSSNVIYDAAGPTVDTTGLSGIQTNATIVFNVTDEYNVSIDSLVVNMTNTSDASDFLIYATAGTNYTGSVDGIISCTELSLDLVSCSFSHDFDDGEYNLSFSVYDSFDQLGVSTLANYTAKTMVSSVSLIQDQGQTTDDLSIYVNWTASTESFIDYYEVSVGTTAGDDDVVAWFSVPSSETDLNITDNALAYNEWYFVNIRVVDTFSGVSASTSTDGITIEDNTPPVNNFVQIIADEGGVWVNDKTQLSLSWNFTDNESAIVGYEYAIGTATYPLPGWDGVVEITDTIQTNVTAVGLNLVDGQTYYVSVKARNSNLFGGNRDSAWSSSAGVIVDTIAPENGYLTYASESIDVDFVDVVFLVGNDSISGISRATLLSRQAELSDGSCSFSGAPDYQEALNATIIGSMTPQNFTFTNLDNGYCYRFALDVYDNAGNSIRYGTNQISTISIDITPPSAVTVSDEGFFTSSTDLYFNWTAAVDAESGVSYYEYALGTSAGASDVVNWTDNGLTRFVTLTNADYGDGHLADEQVYYLSVRAWNDHNDSSFSQSSSDGILYFDFEIPEALDVISVGNLSGPPYYDTSNDDNITITLQGETGLACVWSFFDIDYIDAGSSSFAESCSEIGGNNTYYECLVTNLTQGRYDISVACQDAAGNKQTTALNTDLVLYKDNQPPSLTFTSPSELVVPAESTVFSASVNESSPYNLSYTVVRVENGSIVFSGTYDVIENDTITTSLDLSTIAGEHQFYYSIVDALNNTINQSLTFISNSGQALATTSIDDGYVNAEDDASLDVYFFTELNYTIVNSGGVVYTYNQTNALENKSTFNLTSNLASLDDDEYTIYVNVTGENSTFSKEQNFTLDTQRPEYAIGSFEQSPANPLDEDDNITLNFVWDGDPTEITVELIHNATGSNETLSTSEVAMGFVVYPDMHRYEAIIESANTETATTFDYYWVATDLAGNVNTSPVQSISIENRAPEFDSSIQLFNHRENYSFSRVLNFSDPDSTQSSVSDFFCYTDNGLFNTSVLSGSNCLLNWSNPVAGNYTFNVSVFDVQNGVNLSNDTVSVIVQIYETQTQNISITSNIPIYLDFSPQNSSRYAFLDLQSDYSFSSFASDDITIDLPIASDYIMGLSTDDYELSNLRGDLTILVGNVSVFTPSSILLRALNPAFIEDESADIGSSYRYIPKAAYAIEMNFSTSSEYYVAFGDQNYSQEELDRLDILKFEFDTLSNTINYSSLENLDAITNSFINSTVAGVTNFSAFVLVDNQDQDGDGYFYDVDCRDDNAGINPGATEICGDVTDNNCNGQVDETCSVSSGGGGGSSGGGGGFSSSSSSCSDGIQNGAETGVDCGGTCGLCFEEEPAPYIEPGYCFNGVQDFDEEGIDCGGSCLGICSFEEPFVPPVQPNCFDGIQNQNEQGVDCGGVCFETCEEEFVAPIQEEPTQVEESGSSGILFIFIGLLLTGAVIFFVVRSRDLDLFGFGAPNAVAGKITLNIDSTIADDDIASIARYIEAQQDKDYSTKEIKKHLLSYGYSERNINGAIDAIAQADYLETVQEYLGKYSDEGFTDNELQSWLLEKGIKPHIVAVAMDRHRKDRDSPFKR